MAPAACWLAVTVFAAAAAVTASPAGAQQPQDPYGELIYDYEVALICGIGNEVLQGAYKTARARLEAASPLDAEALTERRIKAMAAADREYSNRGLGGFRPWCDLEGKAGLARIMEAAEK